MEEIKNQVNDKSIGDYLGIIKCLSWLVDTKAFTKWMHTNHSIEYISVHFEGYKLLLNTLLRVLLDEIESNNSLGLSSDELFNRASFKGKSVFQLPNTCEKTIFIKNIISKSEDVLGAKDWEQLSASLNYFSKDVLDELLKIRDISVLNPIFNIDNINTATLYSAIFNVYIFLNDTSRGLPHGYRSSMLDDVERTLKHRSEIANSSSDLFTGYKYGVEYLWFNLLGNTYVDSVVNTLHLTRNWEQFDEYFEKIRSKIINPIELITGRHTGFDDLILVHDTPKLILVNLLKTSKERQFSEKETLRQLFLWYPIQLLDGNENEFTGIHTLIPLLMGTIQHVRRFPSEKQKVKIIRIVHGEESEHRRDYSYAILIEMYGFISDASGWMLFYDCCSDRGSTSGLYRDIENLLRRYNNKHFLQMSNFRIDKDRLVELIKDDLTEINPPSKE